MITAKDVVHTDLKTRAMFAVVPAGRLTDSSGPAFVIMNNTSDMKSVCIPPNTELAIARTVANLLRGLTPWDDDRTVVASVKELNSAAEAAGINPKQLCDLLDALELFREVSI